MGKYRLQHGFDGVVENSTGAFIPRTDKRGLLPSWDEYQDWIAAGNVADADGAYNLDAVKTNAIMQVNSVCRQKIEAKWPDTIQRSIALGIYPSLAAQCTIDVSLMIAHSNDVKTVAINALTTIAEVEAFDINAGWPII